MDCGAAASLYGGVEGAFGSDGGAGGDGDVGECPAPSSGDDCAGAVSNCWSPGQRDTGELDYYLKFEKLYFVLKFQIAQAMVSAVLMAVPTHA